jgi:hypothetical protein
VAVIAFASIAGTAGSTAAMLAAAVHWPRPVLAVEADISNVGAALTGFFRSNLAVNAGMHQVSLAQSRGALGVDALLDPGFAISIAVHALPPVPQMPIPSLPEGHRMWVIPGYRDLQTVDGVTSVWTRLPALFQQLDERGIDVLVDLGRLERGDIRLPVLDGADQVVLLASTTMSDLNRLHKRLRLPDLEERVTGFGRTKYSLLLTRSPYEAVGAAEFERAVLPVLATVAHDPEGAAVFAHGREDRKPTRNRYRGDIRQAVSALGERLADATERKAS